jgi:hypothetical protein
MLEQDFAIHERASQGMFHSHGLCKRVKRRVSDRLESIAPQASVTRKEEEHETDFSN